MSVLICPKCLSTNCDLLGEEDDGTARSIFVCNQCQCMFHENEQPDAPIRAIRDTGAKSMYCANCGSTNTTFLTMLNKDDPMLGCNDCHYRFNLDDIQPLGDEPIHDDNFEGYPGTGHGYGIVEE